VYHRSFRIILLSSILICLVTLPGIISARAAAPAKHAGRGFQPAGHGFVVPQKINTAALKQGTNSQTMSIQQPVTSSSKRASVPYPSNVVSVPVPTTTDPTAKNGVYLNQPKPDANGAGGNYNYLETVNGGVVIYSRSGSRLQQSSYQVWFSKASAQFIDPVAMWDDTGDRFLFSILQQRTSNILLSVAQQANAKGSYCNYTFSDLPGHDFDKLGVDQDGIYISANILSQTTGQVVNNELFYASRTALESCQSLTYTYWTDLTNPDGTIAQAITPARQDSSTSGFEYLVNSYPTGACQLTLWTLTSGGNLSNATIPTQCYSPPPPAPQEGSTALIGTGDSSITQASLVNGLLTVDNLGSYDWGDGNGPVGIVEWYVLNPSTASISNQGAFGTPGYWLFYPSAITTENGNMLFVYNASGKSIYPSVWYVDQTFTDTIALANGTSYYTYEGQHVSPWGDYQSAWPDSSKKTPNSVWITGESGFTPTNWGTKFDLVTPS
jgi:hypothetical protein